jgi:HSP20 family molecular chaperone IbpA
MNDTNAVVEQPEEAREAMPQMSPPVDVYEDASGITLCADMPGVPKEKLILNIEDDTLTIEGDISLGVPEGMEAVHAEIRLGRYKRVFTLSRELNSEQVDAKFENGVLRVRIPKAEHAQAKRIEVQVS